jgi:hypothetical protein
MIFKAGAGAKKRALERDEPFPVEIVPFPLR